MDEKEFPQYLHLPYKVIVFDSDDLGIAVLAMSMALIFQRWPFVILAIAIPLAYMSFKRGYPRGFAKHVMYFLGIADFEGYPGYFEKTFIE